MPREPDITDEFNAGWEEGRHSADVEIGQLRAEIERLRKLLYDITVAWHCGPLPDGTDEMAKLIEGYNAHGVPGPWHKP